MEPAKASIRTKSRVLKVEERFKAVYVGGVGREAKFNRVSLGWFLHLGGSSEAIYIGETDLGIEVGSMAEIVITANTRKV